MGSTETHQFISNSTAEPKALTNSNKFQNHFSVNDIDIVRNFLLQTRRQSEQIGSKTQNKQSGAYTIQNDSSILYTGELNRIPEFQNVPDGSNSGIGTFDERNKLKQKSKNKIANNKSQTKQSNRSQLMGSPSYKALPNNSGIIVNQHQVQANIQNAKKDSNFLANRKSSHTIDIQLLMGNTASTQFSIATQKNNVTQQQQNQKPQQQSLNLHQVQKQFLQQQKVLPQPSSINSARQKSSSRQQVAAPLDSHRQVAPTLSKINKKSFPAPISKIDLSALTHNNAPYLTESELWKEILRFFEYWRIPPLKLKISYTKQEVLDFIRQMATKLSEVEKVTNYERVKADEYKEETVLLKQQVEEYKRQYLDLQNSIKDIKQEFMKHQQLIVKMQECQQELKQTLLNSLMCLDFYKDLESYLHDNRYEHQNPEITRHFDVIQELIQQHGLYSLDFDTERIQKLIDSIQDYIRVKDIEKKIIEIDINDHDCNKSDDDLNHDSNECLRTKNRNLKDKTQQIIGSMGLINQPSKRTNSSSKTRISHQHCTCNGSFQFQQNNYKEELKQKNTQIARLREQLEHKVRKVIELKTQLKRERDQEAQKRQHSKFKDSMIRLEREYNRVVIENTKLQLEQKSEKEDNEKLRIESQMIKDKNKELNNDVNELRKILKDKEGYYYLEQTVNELVNVLVSKKNDQLNSNQRQQLKSIFGNHTVLYKLRQRIQTSEEHIANLGQLLTKSVRLNLSFQDIIEEYWATIKQVHLVFRDSDLSMMSDSFDQINIIRQNLSDQAIDQQERDYAQKLVLFKELRKEISKEQILEEMSKNMAEDKDKISLLSMIVESKSTNQNRKMSYGGPSQSALSSNIFSILETPTNLKQISQGFSTEKDENQYNNMSNQNTIQKRPPKNPIQSQEKLLGKMYRMQSEKQLATLNSKRFGLDNLIDPKYRELNEVQSLVIEDELGEIQDQKYDEYQQLFENSKNQINVTNNDINNDKLRKIGEGEYNSKISEIKDGYSEQRMRSINSNSKAHKISQKSKTINLFGRQNEEDSDKTSQISQLNDTNSINDNTAQSLSRLRVLGENNIKPTRKQLRIKIKELKVKNIQLQQLLKNYQDKINNHQNLYNTSQGNNTPVADLSSTINLTQVRRRESVNREQILHNIIPNTSVLSTIQSQVDDKDFLQIFQLQSQAIESLLCGADL